MDNIQKSQDEVKQNSLDNIQVEPIHEVVDHQLPADYIDLGSILSRHRNLKTEEW